MRVELIQAQHAVRVCESIWFNARAMQEEALQALKHTANWLFPQQDT